MSPRYLECPLCQGQSDLLYETHKLWNFEGWAKIPKDFYYLRCKRCLLVYGNRVLDAEEVSNLYPEAYMNRNVKSKSLDLFRFLENYLNAKRILKVSSIDNHAIEPIYFLDFGSGDSTLSNSLSRINKSVISRAYDPFVNNTSTKDVAEDISSFSNHFGVISLIHTIEHMNKPSEDLLSILKLLRKDGRIFIITPNVSDWSFRFFGRYWCFLHFPYHLILFSKSNLPRYLSLLGYEVEKVESVFAGNTLAYSIENFFKKFLKIRKVGHTRIYMFLVVMLLPIELILYGVGSLNSVQMVTARRKI